MSVGQWLAQLMSSLQDPQKVARFQQLCGVEALASCTAAAAADPREDEKAEAHLTGESRRRERQPGPSGGPPPPGSDRNQCPAKLGDGGAPNGVRNGRATEVGPASPRCAGLLRRNSLTDEEGQLAHVSNWPLHYLFCFGTELGNELFYILFFPFWIWNLDALVGRRLVVIWVLVMYLGQCTKDIIRWPRPASPPVVKLEVFYNSEYSMPSTHAMSGTAIPISMILLTYGRWQETWVATQKTWIRSLCRKIPRRQAWQPSSVFLPGEFRGPRSLMDLHSLWGRRKLDTTLSYRWQHTILFWT